MERPNLFVISRFLRRLEDHPDGVSRARLQVLVRLNYDIFRRYLDLLEARGHVEAIETDGATLVVLTAGGRDAHRRLREALIEWLREPNI